VIREEPIQIPFQYAAGAVASRFLLALRDDAALVASRCTDCERTVCPARSLCPVCGARTAADRVQVGPLGRLTAWTLDGDAAYGLVQLDGADTALIHRLLPRDFDWRRGQQVRARFAQDRVGSVLDIEGFEAVAP